MIRLGICEVGGVREKTSEEAVNPVLDCVSLAAVVCVCVCGRKGHDKSLTFVPINNNLVVLSRRQTQNTLLRLQTRSINECTFFFFPLAEKSNSKQITQHRFVPEIKSTRPAVQTGRIQSVCRDMPDPSAWVAVATV